MVVTGATVKFTYEDYCNAPEDRRYELHDGDLILVPSPKEQHQDLVGSIYFLLRGFVMGERTGRAYIAPFDVVLSDYDVVQPDVLFVSNDRLDIITADNIQGAPDLVVEVLSPSTAHRDRTYKRSLYARHGVTEFWLVDPVARTIEVLLLDANGYDIAGSYGAGDTLASPTLTEFTLRIDDIFQGA